MTLAERLRDEASRWMPPTATIPALLIAAAEHIERVEEAIDSFTGLCVFCEHDDCKHLLAAREGRPCAGCLADTAFSKRSESGQ